VRTVTIEKMSLASEFIYSTALPEDITQRGDAPCEANAWDLANATNLAICREFRKKAFDKSLEKPNFAGDMMFNDGSSLGNYCGRTCAVEAEAEVVLIYWPPVVTSRDICASNGYGEAKTLTPDTVRPSIVTMDAITFQGRNMNLKSKVWSWTGDLSARTETFDGSAVGPSVLKGPFTFTSPTVYLAHHRIVGSTLVRPQDGLESSTTVIRTAGVIPLKADEVYSLRPPRKDAAQISGLEYARLVASGKYDPVWKTANDDLGMVAFDFGHLADPVPASVHYDARSEECWGILKQTHCGTITDGQYRPQLAFRDKIWKSVVGEWYDCNRPGLVDPPIALIPAYTLNAPQLPKFTPAQPGDHISQPWSQPTAAAVQRESPYHAQQTPPPKATLAQVVPADVKTVRPGQFMSAILKLR
jgi:hypothetical protein